MDLGSADAVTERALGTYEYVREDRTLDEMELTAYRIGDGEPHVVVTAGIHGNEIGPQVLAEEDILELVDEPAQGSVSVIPHANMFACREGERESKHRWAQNESEEGDLNRVFRDALDAYRGGEDATAMNREERIAYEIVRYLGEAPDDTYLVDMHSAAWPEVKTPQVRYKQSDRFPQRLVRTMDHMARYSGLHHLMRTDTTGERSTMLAAVAPRMGIPAVTLEIGGAEKPEDPTVRFHEEDRERYRTALGNVLGAVGVLDHDPEETEMTEIGGLEKRYADVAGVVRYRRELGDAVAEGEVVAEVYDLDAAEVRREVTAPVDGVLEARMERPDPENDGYHGPFDQGTRLFNVARRG